MAAEQQAAAAAKLQAALRGFLARLLRVRRDAAAARIQGAGRRKLQELRAAARRVAAAVRIQSWQRGRQLRHRHAAAEVSIAAYDTISALMDGGIRSPKVVAFVVGDVADAELDALCLAHIARFKRPKRYVRVADLPKNNYGKVLKTELREILKRARGG